MEFPLNRLIPSLGLLSLLMLAANPAYARQPNFVFVLVDDLGYMDIGANNPGTFYETPNVDRLAALVRHRFHLRQHRSAIATAMRPGRSGVVKAVFDFTT